MNIKSEICKKFTGTFLLLCFFLLSLHALFSYSPVNYGFVYCPLQAKWVKRGEEKVSVIKDFNDFCATDKRKEFIKSKIHLKTRFSQIIAENLVFDYLEKGDQVSALFNHLPEVPSREHIKKSSTISSATNFFDLSIKIATEKFSLKQAARPPTFSAQAFFSFQFTRPLSKISRNINPRSPPIFI